MDQRSEIKVIIAAETGDASRKVADFDRSISKFGESAKAAAFQARNLSAQMTDIGVGLATGQSPLMVLLQQGGQLKDIYGGVGPALKAVGGAVAAMITPVTVAGAAIGLLAVQAKKGHDESRELANSLALTGNIAGVTAGSFEEAARRISATSQATILEAKGLVQAAISNGAFGPQAVAAITTAAARIQQITGETSEEVIRRFNGMAGGAAAWAAEANKSYHFLDLAQYKLIKRLEEQGKAQEAMTLAATALGEKLGQRLPTELGLLDKALVGTAKLWDEFWDSARAIGRPGTLEQQLGSVRAELEANARRTDRADSVGPNGQRKGADKRDAELRAQARALEQAIQLQRQGASADAAKAVSDAAAVAKEIEDNKNKKPPKTASQIESEYRSMVQQTLANRSAVASFRQTEGAGYDETNKQVAEVAAREAEQARRRAEELAEREKEQLRRRQELAADFADQVRDQTSALSASLIKDDRERGLAQIEIERTTMQRRLDELAKGGANIAEAQAALNENIAARQGQLEEDLKPEWQKLLESWGDTTHSMQKAYDDAMTGILQNGADAFAELVTTGKLNTRNLVNFMIAEFARLQFKQAVSSFSDSDFIKSIFAAFSSGGSSTPSADPVPGRPRGGAATGSNYIERDMLTILHEGEAVIPKKYNPAAGARVASGLQVSIPTNVQIDARTDQAQILQLVSEAMQRTKQQLYQELHDLGVL